MNRHLIFIPLLAAASFLIYADSLQGGFVWDDLDTISYCGRITPFFESIFPEKGKGSYYYRPLLMLTISTDCKFWGRDPLGFHLTNVLLHTLNVILVYVFGFLIFSRFYSGEKSSWLSLFSSLLWSLHPTHAESVAWVSGRTDVVCMTFFISSVVAYDLLQRKNNVLLAFLSAFLFLLALFTKEAALSLIFVLPLYYFLIVRGKGREFIKTYSLFLIVALTFMWFWIRARPELKELPDFLGIGINGEEFSTYLFILKTVSALGYYVKQLVFSEGFKIYMSLPLETSHLILSFLSLFILLLLLCLFFFRRDYIGLWGISFVIVTLMPTLGLVLFTVSTTPIAERYLYIPSVGFSILLACFLFRAALLISRISRGKTAQPQILFGLFCLLIVGGYAELTMEKNKVWKNNFNFWEKVVKQNPEYGVGLINYANALLARGRDEEAKGFLHRALKTQTKLNRRGLALATNNLGVAYLKTGEYALAEKYLRESVKYSKSTGYLAGLKFTYLNLGRVYLARAEAGEKELFPEAERYFRYLIKLDPKYLSAYFSLGRTLRGMGRKEEAKAVFDKLESLIPEGYRSGDLEEEIAKLDRNNEGINYGSEKE